MPSPLKWVMAMQNITSSLQIVRIWNVIVLGIWVPWRPSTLRMGPSFPKQHHSWSLVLTLHIRCGRPHPSQYMWASHPGPIKLGVLFLFKKFNFWNIFFQNNLLPQCENLPPPAPRGYHFHNVFSNLTYLRTCGQQMYEA